MTDVYLLIMDCLRHDVIDMEVDGKPLMPNLKAFKERSVNFSNAFASAPSTHFAVPTIMTGLLPFTIDDKQGINEDAPYLPEVFRDRGYRTLGYTTNAVTSHIFGYSRGFDIYRDFLESGEISMSYRLRKKLVYILEKASPRRRRVYDLLMLPLTLYSKMTGWKLNPEVTNYRIMDTFDGSNIIDAFGRDLGTNESSDHFGFLHFVDTHAPYAPPEKYMRGRVKEKFRAREYLEDFFETIYTDEEKVINDQELRRRNWNLYLSSCKYQDDLFKSFMDIVTNRKIADEPIIIVMSDHGEAFGRHGYLQHQRTKFSRPHIRIPFIISGPGIGSGEYDLFMDETDIFDLVISVALEKKPISSITPFNIDKEMILTLGYSGTYSLTTKKARYISDDEGRRIFKFRDELEENPKEVDDEVASFFGKQAESIRKKMKARIDPKSALRSNIRSMKISKNT